LIKDVRCISSPCHQYLCCRRCSRACIRKLKYALLNYVIFRRADTDIHERINHNNRACSSERLAARGAPKKSLPIFSRYSEPLMKLLHCFSSRIKSLVVFLRRIIFLECAHSIFPRVLRTSRVISVFHALGKQLSIQLATFLSSLQNIDP
jgi:hypothetical protein